MPTTVFTPLEMAAVGMTEVEAIATHGQHSIEVSHMSSRDSGTEGAAGRS